MSQNSLNSKNLIPFSTKSVTLLFVGGGEADFKENGLGNIFKKIIHSVF